MESVLSSQLPGLEQQDTAPCMAAVAHLKSNDDIDAFIANVTVPPPPMALAQAVTSAAVKRKGDDISAFIIPPPPPTRAPPASVESTPVHHKRSSTSDKISPKIASLQQRLAGLSANETESEAVDEDVPPPPPPPRLSGIRYECPM